MGKIIAKGTMGETLIIDTEEVTGWGDNPGLRYRTGVSFMVFLKNPLDANNTDSNVVEIMGNTREFETLYRVLTPEAVPLSSGEPKEEA